MALQIGNLAPDFDAETTEGPISFYKWLGRSSWCVLFSHPKDFTPVCTTELGYVARLKPEFDRRNTKIIGLSVDPVEDHTKWAQDIAETQGYALNYPLIADTDLKISRAWSMLPGFVEGSSAGRTAADNQTVRNVFIIDPDKRIQTMFIYPMAVGRNFDEVLRALDALQLAAAHRIATPANWMPGEDVIIAASVSDEDAKKTYPEGWRALRPYLRIVPQPGKRDTGATAE
jgi:alkyl hydroperoxide reductase subunit AhpC